MENEMQEAVARAFEDAVFFGPAANRRRWRTREWSFGLGRFWGEVSYNPVRRYLDLHGVGWSFTLTLGPLGVQGGIEDWS